MCGICGIVRFDGRPADPAALSLMMKSLVHRGPDDEGTHFSSSPGASAALGFRRLSIIDIEGGHQPMRLGPLTIVFNGEVYNFRKIRRSCEARGAVFKTHSDTEAILHLFRLDGPSCVDELNGMFAFAVWNEETEELFLARDRMGIKPLYYFSDGKKIVFGSEVRAVTKSGEVRPEVDPTGLMDTMSFRFVPAPHTILKDIFKVTPGTLLTVKGGRVSEKSYWSVNLEELRRPSPSMNEAADELLMLLEESVTLQMISDVPLGGFLSGGVDSSLVAALMAKHASGRVKTFSIGFEKGTGVDESAYARQVAAFIGTEHHEMILSEADLSYGEKVFSRMNEPVTDPTVLPTAILSEFARKSVTVALTGEGGDELFAGYNRYKSVIYAAWVQRFPPVLRPAASFLFRRAGRGESFRAIPDVSVQNWFDLNRDSSSERLGGFLSSPLRGPWNSYLPERIAPVLQNPGTDALNAVLEIERQTFLADRLLMKVDMASMGYSLEARPPYLDHRIVEFAFSLPARFKVRRFKGKYVLRTAAARLLPSNIAWRRKHGFIVPLGKWLGGHSEDWVRSMLGSPALESAGVFDQNAIRSELGRAFRHKEGDSLAVLWPMIVIGAWLESLL